jgi:hypothetical protein
MSRRVIVSMTVILGSVIAGFASSPDLGRAASSGASCPNTACETPQLCMFRSGLVCSLEGPGGPCTTAFCDIT